MDKKEQFLDQFQYFPEHLANQSRYSDLEIGEIHVYRFYKRKIDDIIEQITSQKDIESSVYTKNKCFTEPQLQEKDEQYFLLNYGYKGEKLHSEHNLSQGYRISDNISYDEIEVRQFVLEKIITNKKYKKLKKLKKIKSNEKCDLKYDCEEGSQCDLCEDCYLNIDFTNRFPKEGLINYEIEFLNIEEYIKLFYNDYYLSGNSLMRKQMINYLSICCGKSEEEITLLFENYEFTKSNESLIFSLSLIGLLNIIAYKGFDIMILLNLLIGYGVIKFLNNKSINKNIDKPKITECRETSYYNLKKMNNSGFEIKFLRIQGTIYYKLGNGKEEFKNVFLTGSLDYNNALDHIKNGTKLNIEYILEFMPGNMYYTKIKLLKSPENDKFIVDPENGVLKYSILREKFMYEIQDKINAILEKLNDITKEYHFEGNINELLLNIDAKNGDDNNIIDGISFGVLESKYIYTLGGSTLFGEVINNSYYKNTIQKEINIISKLNQEQSLVTKNDINSDVFVPSYEIIDLGCGDGSRSSNILKELGVDNVVYNGVDFSFDMGLLASETIQNNFKGSIVNNNVIDFQSLGRYIRNYFFYNKTIFFLGFTLGNFEKQELEDLLQKIQKILYSGDNFIVSVFTDDQNEVEIQKLYNNEESKNFVFNFFLKYFENKDLQEKLEYFVEFNREKSQVEIGVKFKKDIVLKKGKEKIKKSKGDKVICNISRRFRETELQELFENNGMKIEKSFTQDGYGVFCVRKKKN